MDPLSITTSIIAIFQLTTTVLSFLEKLKNASEEQRRLTVEMPTLYGLLASLKLHLEEENFAAPWLKEVEKLAAQGGPLDQYQNALEELKEKIRSRNKRMTLGKMLTQKSTKKEIENILSRIERLKSLVQIALEMDHLELSSAINNRLNLLHRDTQTIKNDTTEIRRFIADNTLSEIAEWLSPSSHPSRQNDILAQRLEGTGRWFLDSREFKTWTSYPKQILFCFGIPGAGKTTISAIAIDNLLQIAYGNDIAVAYIYCNYKADQDQTTTALPAAVLKQLVQFRPITDKAVQQLYNRHTNQQTRPSLKEIRDTLCIVLTRFSCTYVVVDALDECPNHNGTRHQFLAELCKLQTDTDLRLMFTSRAISEIENEFGKALTLEVRASPEDVGKYVSSRIDQLSNCIRDDDALQKLVLEKISETANGMFLFARLSLDSLQDKYTPKKVRSALQQFVQWSKTSESIEEAFDKVYSDVSERINSQSAEARKLAKGALSWATYAKRDLTATQLCYALAVEADKTELDLDEIPSIKDVITVCTGLVTQDRNSSTVRLVHDTTRAYLERTGDRWIPSAQIDTALTCLTFLYLKNDNESPQTFRNGPFLDYATRFWSQHTLPVQEEVADLAYATFKSGNLEIYAKPITLEMLETPDFTQRSAAQVTGLHITAYHGLCYLLAGLLQNLGASASSQVNTKDKRGQTPLFWAAHGGHDSTVGILLDRSDVDVETRDKHGRTVLSVAAHDGHTTIVNELLRRYPHLLDETDIYGRTALSLATEMNHLKTVLFLLDFGASISTTDNQRKGILHHAVNNIQCPTPLIELLLRRGAPFEEPDVENMTPLHIAVKFNMKEIVTTLLNNQVPVNLKVYRRAYNIRPKYPGNLHSPCGDLYDQQPPLGITNAEGGLTPLHYAALVGNNEMTEFLLDMDADPNALSEYNETPLELAQALMIKMPYYEDDWTDDHYRAENILPFLDFRQGDDVESALDDVVARRSGVLRVLLDNPRARITGQKRIDAETLYDDYMQNWKLREVAHMSLKRFRDVFVESDDNE